MSLVLLGRHYRPVELAKTMHEELQQARQERDDAFNNFIDESAKANKHSLKARAARNNYVLARDTVRALERDLLAMPIV